MCMCENCVYVCHVYGLKKECPWDEKWRSPFLEKTWKWILFLKLKILECFSNFLILWHINTAPHLWWPQTIISCHCYFTVVNLVHFWILMKISEIQDIRHENPYPIGGCDPQIEKHCSRKKASLGLTFNCETYFDFLIYATLC